MTNHYICVVDADIIAYRVAAACEEESQERMEDTLRGNIYEMWRETKASNYLFTLTGSTNYRNDVATIKPYKGNRKDVQRPKWLAAAKQYLTDEYKAITVEPFEGDDVCVSVAHRYRDYNPIIASVDKDLLQYPAFHYNLVKKTMEEVDQTTGDFILWKQVLTGDSTDNIGGLPNVGPKKAEKWLEDHSDIPYPHAAWMMYDEMGYSYEYFQEIVDLIRMRTDVYAPYEPNFIQLDYTGTEEEEFDFE